MILLKKSELKLTASRTNETEIQGIEIGMKKNLKTQSFRVFRNEVQNKLTPGTLYLTLVILASQGGRDRED
jgi:hypothetical protein